MTMYKNVDGVQVEMSAEEEAQIIAEQSQWATEKAAVQYQYDRRAAYPSIADQLDQIYHEGIDAWKETIAAVKAEYPKP